MQVNGVQLRGCTLKPCEEDSEAGLGVYTTDGYLENGVFSVWHFTHSVSQSGICSIVGSLFKMRTILSIL